MSTNKRRVDVFFDETEDDLWEFLVNQSISRPKVMKMALRRFMEGETINEQLLEQKIVEIMKKNLITTPKESISHSPKPEQKQTNKLNLNIGKKFIADENETKA